MITNARRNDTRLLYKITIKADASLTVMCKNWNLGYVVSDSTPVVNNNSWFTSRIFCCFLSGTPHFASFTRILFIFSNCTPSTRAIAVKSDACPNWIEVLVHVEGLWSEEFYSLWWSWNCSFISVISCVNTYLLRIVIWFIRATVLLYFWMYFMYGMTERYWDDR